jgi:hypothetical protein
MARTVFEFKRQWNVEVDNISELLKPLLINCITHQLLIYYSSITHSHMLQYKMYLSYFVHLVLFMLVPRCRVTAMLHS